MGISGQILVPALVSGVVAISVAIISAVMSARSQNVEQKKQQAQLQREMTKLLYEKRLEIYPKYMQLTNPLLRRNIQAAPDKREHFSQVRDELEKLQMTEAGFVVSTRTLGLYHELRQALKVEPEGQGDEYSYAQIGRIIDGRAKFRGALRSDMFLIYGEDPAESSE